MYRMCRHAFMHAGMHAAPSPPKASQPHLQAVAALRGMQGAPTDGVPSAPLRPPLPPVPPRRGITQHIRLPLRGAPPPPLATHPHAPPPPLPPPARSCRCRCRCTSLLLRWCPSLASPASQRSWWSRWGGAQHPPSPAREPPPRALLRSCVCGGGGGGAHGRRHPRLQAAGPQGMWGPRCVCLRPSLYLPRTHPLPHVPASCGVLRGWSGRPAQALPH